MEFNWNNFTKAYQSASEEKRLLIDSSTIAECVQNLIADKLLHESHCQLLVTAISHHVLHATSEGEIIVILEKAGINNTLNLVAKTLTCLEGKGSIKSELINNVIAQSEISEVENDLAAIQTVRTMSHDMAAIRPGSDVVYQSSQADILRAPEPVVTPPVPETPRWDTDTRK
jgi:hypothetical protein